jgi:cytochrome c peroxidase
MQYSKVLLALLPVFALVLSGAPAKKVETYERDAAKQLYRRPSQVPYPKDNPHTPERELLGRTLFFDPRLSSSKVISCATCHNPGFSWGDGLPLAIGHGAKVLGRRTPTILNLAWTELLFWDGRAGSLEEQALGPIAAPGEMNQPMEKMVQALNSIKGYQAMFDRAYPGQPITKENVGKAIATFERTVVSGLAPFDRWVDGDERAISESAKRGFDLFNTKAACAKCHNGWNFTDGGFHDIGVKGDDRGRGAVLNLPAMQYAFKTPTLRNVDQRAPYLHDGSEATLEDVIELYDAGGRINRPSLSPEIFKLNLTAEDKHNLKAFLLTLTSRDPAVNVPVLPVN